GWKSFVTSVTIAFMPNDSSPSPCPHVRAPWTIRHSPRALRTLSPAMRKARRGKNAGGLFVLHPVDDESTTVRRSHVAAVMATGAAFPSPTLVLRGILLQLHQVGVELLLLIGGEDGAHRREPTLALLLHLRTQGLHLRTRRRRVPALPGRAGVCHGLSELVIRLLTLTQLL